jgi:hypothetical protein
MDADTGLSSFLADAITGVVIVVFDLFSITADF